MTYADNRVRASEAFRSVEAAEPRTLSVEEFQRRTPKTCAKCRQSKPLVAFGAEYHTNRTTGRRVFHGYADRCLDCEAAPTERGNH